MTDNEGYKKNIISNVLYLNAWMEALRIPLQVISGFGGLLIAMQTLQVVTRQLRGEQIASMSMYARQAKLNQINNREKQEEVYITKVSREEMKAYLISKHNVAKARMRNVRATEREIIGEQQSVQAQLASILAEHKGMEITDKATAKKIANLKKRDEAMKAQLHSETGIVAIATIRHRQMGQEAIAFDHNNKKNFENNALRKRSIEIRFAEQEMFKSEFYNRLTENNLLKNQFTVRTALTAKQKEALTARLSNINAGILDTEQEMASLRHKERAILASGRSEKAIKKKTAAVKLEIDAIKEKMNILIADKAAVENHMAASDIAKTRMKGYTEEIKNQSRWFITNAFAAQASEVAMKRMRMAAGFMSFFLSMSASNTREMVAAMIAVPIAVGAITLALKIYNGTLLETITLQAAATMGISLIIGSVAAIAAYEGTNWLMGEMGVLEDAKTELSLVNDELTNTLGLMDELSQRGDTHVSALLGETTYNDLKENSDLTAESLKIVKGEIDALTKARDAGLEKDSAEYKALQWKINGHQQAYNEISVLHDAHQIRMNASALDGETDRYAIMENAYSNIGDLMTSEYHDPDSLGGDIKKLMTFSDYEDFTYTFTDPYHEGEGEAESFSVTVDAAEAARHGFGSRDLDWVDRTIGDIKFKDDEHGLVKATKGGRDEYAAHLLKQHFVDPTREAADDVVDNWMGVAAAQITYSDNVLAVVKENNEAAVESHLQAAGAIENEFDNMRQELFFGEKGNFTGALFKEMRTNGVENLLYKTEIMQTNNFYGLTMTDAVSEIEEALVSRLRAAGVPVE